jgi:predicted nucleotidyltransferase
MAAHSFQYGGNMLAQNLTVPQVALADFCRKYHIRKLAFFGSVLGNEFGAASDVDILVEFEEGHVPGFAFFDLQDELSGLLGHQVDLHTPKSLSRYFRDQVIAEATIMYEQR